MKLKDLQAQRNALAQEGQDIMTAYRSEDRKPTEAELKRMDEIMAELNKVTETISAETEEQERERAFTIKPSDIDRPRLPQALHPTPEGMARGYEIGTIEATHGFESVGHFGRAVMQAFKPGATPDPRLFGPEGMRAQPTNFHRESGSGDGEGYTVPPQYRDEIWDMIFTEADFLGMTTSEPTTSNHVEFLRDETTPWGATGVKAAWRSEGVKMDPTKMDMESDTLKLNDMYVFVLATEELAEDSPRLMSRLGRRSAEAFRWKIGESIIYGDGVGKMLGYMNSGALVTQAKETSQSADTIVVQNLAKMYSRQLMLGDAVWIANQDIFPELVNLTIGNQPVWTLPTSDRGLQVAPSGFIFGRPLLFSEHAKTLGALGDIQFASLTGYYSIFKSGGLRFASSIHLYFDYNMQAFRWTFRIAGQPFLSKPVTPNNGTNTRSHFVTLEERA